MPVICSERTHCLGGRAEGTRHAAFRDTPPTSHRSRRDYCFSHSCFAAADIGANLTTCMWQRSRSPSCSSAALQLCQPVDDLCVTRLRMWAGQCYVWAGARAARSQENAHDTSHEPLPAVAALSEWQRDLRPVVRPEQWRCRRRPPSQIRKRPSVLVRERAPAQPAPLTQRDDAPPALAPALWRRSAPAWHRLCQYERETGR